MARAHSASRKCIAVEAISSCINFTASLIGRSRFTKREMLRALAPGLVSFYPRELVLLPLVAYLLPTVPLLSASVTSNTDLIYMDHTSCTPPFLLRSYLCCANVRLRLGATTLFGCQPNTVCSTWLLSSGKGHKSNLGEWPRVNQSLVTNTCALL